MKRLKNVSLKEIGQVVEISPPVIKIEGLPGVKSGEVVLVGKEKAIIFKFTREFTTTLFYQDFAYGLCLESPKNIKTGDKVERTGELLKIPVGEKFLSRVIDPLGRDIETGKELKVKETSEIEKLPPQIIERGLVREALETGIKVIDALFPIGRGQRELILGDRKTGKTSLVVDAILNQKDVISIYCSIGQRKSEVLQLDNIFRKFGVKKQLVIVSAFSSDPPVLQYLAPFSAMTLAEFFRDQGKDVLVVFDDLTKHAKVWRQICLLLEIPPGREAYPGDIFYLHARLLERAGKLSDDKGGSSITALPICETKEGDITEYIPTNLISITDGQIYLETDLFQKAQIPAVNIGLSVSRIGAFAQRKYLREVTGGLKLLLSQHKELKKLVQLETEVSKAAQRAYKRAEILLEIFKQEKHKLVDSLDQSIIYFAILNGFFDDINPEKVREIETKFYRFLDDIHKEVKLDLKKFGWIKPVKEEIKKVIIEFRNIY
ncbi:F0F1 ATP synthase subunit alpha [bacterium]|nr:F0F1 ATP synthase subunit alpha [bacterium]